MDTDAAREAARRRDGRFGSRPASAADPEVLADLAAQGAETCGSLQFAEAARRLATEARGRGLTPPSFRSPPRSGAGATRTIRWRADGTAVVSVRIRGRSLEEVAGDLVDGVLAANGRASDDPARGGLLAAALDDRT